MAVGGADTVICIMAAPSGLTFAAAAFQSLLGKSRTTFRRGALQQLWVEQTL
jgi:hypothetical protein